MRTSPSQFETMVTFMEQYGDLSKPATHARGRLASIQHWQELTNLLNSDGSGDTKTTEKWKKVWSDYKNNTKKKAARIHRAAQGTGGGLAVHTKLSDLEHRVLNLIGMQAATGLAIDEAGVSQQEEIVEQNETEPTDEVPNLNMEVLDYVDIEESEDPMLSSRAEIASPPPSSMARPISPNIHVDANVIVEEFRSSKSNLSKTKSKENSDEAEEKLLQKEDEAKIATRVDMAEAKYVVGDHRNGDAKIELDANKRQFSGLTKEELLKYAEDPFWVRLRWFMFVLFWALWLAMLAAAIAIIVRAPKCAPQPPPKTWYEIGPLVDYESSPLSAIDEDFSPLEVAQTQGVFVSPCTDAYEVLEPSSTCLETFKRLAEKAKGKFKLIVDLTANYVSTNHSWFKQSVNGSEKYSSYFMWAKSSEVDSAGLPKVPNQWRSVKDGEAWGWNERREEYFLHQFADDLADLNFHNKDVVAEFDNVLKTFMAAGAAGFRLQNARLLLVNSSLPNDPPVPSTARQFVGASLQQYDFYRHKHTFDQPQLAGLLRGWSKLIADSDTNATVFTIAESGKFPAWHLLKDNAGVLRPPSAPPVTFGDVPAALNTLSEAINTSAALVLGSDGEVSPLATLLPVTVVLTPAQLKAQDNDTKAALAALRRDPTVQHGLVDVQAVPALNSTNQLVAVARWKSGHSGYCAVFNPGASARANLTALRSLPTSATVFIVSQQTGVGSNYTRKMPVRADDVLVPAYSGIVLQYVPDNTANN